MLRTLRHLLDRPPVQVEFCDRCGSVCDQTCRANQLREQARLRALTLGPRSL